MSNTEQSGKMWSGRWPRTIVALALGLILLGNIASAQLRCPQDQQPEATPRAFIISYQSIYLPIGAILLVRRGDELGAVHLTSLNHDLGTKPRVSEWIGSLSYETYYRHGAGSFSQADAIHRTGQLEWGRIRGFGFHYSWQPGNKDAMIGPWKFRFYDQHLMGMSSFSDWNGDQKDRGFEFAPTSACNIDQVNLNDPKLKWYGFNQSNAKITLSLADLSKQNTATERK